MQPPEPEPFTPARWPVYALVGVLVWFVLTAAWMTRPVIDHVPTGVVDGTMTTQEVTCHNVFSSSDRPDEPLPELAPPRSYAHEPCVGPHAQNRLMFGIDVVVVVVAGAWLGRRALADRRPARAAPTTEGSGTPPVASGR